MDYDFDKGIPVPTTVERVGVNIELLKAMPVGESKWWPEDETKRAARFYRVAKKLGIGILIRKVGSSDPRGPGVRMWRTTEGPAPVGDPLLAAAERATKAAKRPAKGGGSKAPKKTAPKAAKAVKKAAPKAKAKGRNGKKNAATVATAAP